jgi:tetratricopeptide (TPR) repeat protein
VLLRFPVTSRDIYLVQVFFIPAFAIVALWIGIGIAWLMSKVLVLATALGFHLRRHLGMAMGYLAPLLAMVPLWGNFAANDRSQETLAVELGRNILATVEPGALLLTSRDTPTFSLAFARIVEGLRPEVSLQHTGQADIFRHLKPPAKPLNPSDRAIYGTTPADLPEIPGWAPYQVGIIYQLRKAPAETDQRLRIWDRYNLKGIEGSRHREDFFLGELIRNYATARANLAQELAQEGRFQLALREAGGALAMDSTFFGAHLTLGNIYFQKGDYKQATRAYGHALSWVPENIEVMNNLALTSLRMGDVNGAIQLYRRSVLVEPLLAKTHNDLGLAYKAAGLYGQAAVEYRRAMELDPDYADPLRNLGVVYAYHLMDYSRAISLWEKYLYLRPQDQDQGMIADEIRRMKNLMEDK